MTHNIELSVKPNKKFSLLLILSVVVAHKIESTSIVRAGRAEKYHPGCYFCPFTSYYTPTVQIH